jgi:hypothetical protein
MDTVHQQKEFLRMSFSKKLLLVLFVVALATSQINAAVDSTFHCYLLFGQSNMAGGGAGNQNDRAGLIASDCDTTPRIKVLAFCNCSAGYSADTIGGIKFPGSRVLNQWYTAYPPIHICTEGISPGTYFARTLIDSVRSDIKIGLIPCALSGQAMKVFVKGDSNFAIPTWAQPTLGNSSPYAWMLARCKLAQQTGVIKGILIHQGESGSGGSAWGTMTKGILDSLKKDLNLPDSTPVVVGELRQDTVTPKPCCASFNTTIDAFATSYKRCGLASSKGLSGNKVDGYHFNCASMRTLGARYAQAFLALSSATYIPRKNATATVQGYNDHVQKYQNMKSATGAITIYSVNGRILHTYSAAEATNALRNLNAKGVYIVSRKLANGSITTFPVVKE